MLTGKRTSLRVLAACVAFILLYIGISSKLGSARYRLYPFANKASIENQSNDQESNRSNNNESYENEPNPPHLPCSSWPGANDILLILRTGSTELQDRFPIHTYTSLRCFPHHLIFSDHEEDFLSEHILDALDSVNPNITAHHPDFELYRRLKQDGRAALAPSELSGPDVLVEGATGNADNPGWKLDKWKFLPMLNRTLFEYGDMKWYVFTEADTLIFWSTLQSYLAATDHTKPHYAGDRINVGDIAFAHGGTGFIVSQLALRIVVEYYTAHKAEVEAFTDQQWAGDTVLGQTFADSGVPLTDVYPLMQGQDPGVVLYARETPPSIPKEDWQVWCSPTVSHHHLTPTVLEDLWRIEQEWLRTRTEKSDVLRHKDIFKHHVMPQMMEPRLDWDNLSENEQTGVTSVEECRAACEAEAKCRQYSYDEAGRCKTRINPRLGLARTGIRSGWIEDRITRFESEMAPCGNEGLDLVAPVI